MRYPAKEIPLELCELDKDDPFNFVHSYFKKYCPKFREGDRLFKSYENPDFKAISLKMMRCNKTERYCAPDAEVQAYLSKFGFTLAAYQSIPNLQNQNSTDLKGNINRYFQLMRAGTLHANVSNHQKK